MKPINTRGQRRTPLPTVLAPTEGAKTSGQPILITQRKQCSKAVLPPLPERDDERDARAAGNWRDLMPEQGEALKRIG